MKYFNDYFRICVTGVFSSHTGVPGGVASSPPPYPGPPGAGAPSMAQSGQPQPYPSASGYPGGPANLPPPSSMQYSYPTAPPYPI